ncbi:MAG: hypothetical protein R3265_15275 [Hyphomonas sp.]|nr:hypothetical protein [Hyphomonas sp.]
MSVGFPGTSTILILLSTIVSLGLLLWPKIRTAEGWRATITPLASIIGSGFLVLGPILDASYGKYAPLVMLALCAAAYAFGYAIRFNIRRIADTRSRSREENWLEEAASWALAFAYCISVAYYLNLFGAFALSLTGLDNALYPKILTSVVLLFIVTFGLLSGFSTMEKMEQLAVSLKLAIITGLLVGLAFFFGEKASTDELVLNSMTETGWHAIALAFGLIVTVQGFETSRYLSDEYKAGLRIRSMRWAQGLSTLIYMIYVILLSYLFLPDQLELTETAIVDMMKIVAPVLPGLLVAAALSAQFSAAVADASGAGGLAEEVSRGRIKPRHAYLILGIIGAGLTWFANVFEIISYASKAFALYYAIQSVIALAGDYRTCGKITWRGMLFASLGLLGIAILLFGQPAEGG